MTGFNHAPFFDSIHEMLSRHPPCGLLVAVSGGPDSVALLSVLKQMGVPKLVVGHVNHHLRGSQSDADAEFTVNLARQLELECEVESVDVAAVSAGRNVEAVARRLRYDALRRIAHRLKFDTIATAHTLDDQAETVLLRLFRGTGLAGLAGIAPVRNYGNVRIIRPFLRMQRKEIIQYLQNLSIPYQLDASNWDERFARNRLRQRVLPALSAIAHPGWATRLAQLADEARHYARFQFRRAKQILQQTELPRAGENCILRRDELSGIPVRQRLLLLRWLWRREHWPTGEMSRRHWQRVALLCDHGPAAMDLPGGIRAQRLDRVVRFGPGA